jgi:hypothetical protein
MPQRGYGLQPRVAASATLGTSKKRNFNHDAIATFSQKETHKADATAFAVEDKIAFFTPGVSTNSCQQEHYSNAYSHGQQLNRRLDRICLFVELGNQI